MGRRVLVIGAGGREHALAWRLSESPSVDEVISAPGNPGTAQVGRNVDVDPTDGDAVAALAAELEADLVVIGPEAPLVAGVADVLRANGIAAFGPGADAAQIEGSKRFAKEIMDAAGAPTAAYGAFTDASEAKAALDGFTSPYVVKADGLAAGKGVRICLTREEAEQVVDEMLVDGAFGAASATIVIEDFLHGPEMSLFGVCDGEDVVLLTPSQDFKRAHDGDEGLNTGGMGAYTPLPGFDRSHAAPLADSVFRPVLKVMAERGTPFRGLLYAGFVLTLAGPRLLEFNARFGDPETQVVLPALKSDLGDLLWASATGSMADVDVAWHDDAVVTVVLASGGYPESYPTGVAITGVADADALDGVQVFHAGTKMVDGTLVTAGGRVLTVTARGATLTAARDLAYAAADLIHFDGIHRRSDIARDAAAVG